MATGSSLAANLVGMGSLDGPQMFMPQSELAYEVRDLEGKGKGVVATRGIDKGEVFMVNFPAVLVEGALLAGMNGPSRSGLLRNLVGGFGRGGEGASA